VKVGVIGAGSIGTRHITNLLKLGHEVIVFDPAMPDPIPGTKTTQTIDNLWSAKPTAVFVCTPTSMHLEHATLALMNHCHVFIEKPISHSLNGIKNLEKLAKLKNKHVFVACNMRFHSSIKRIKHALDKGTIGKIVSLHAEFGHYLPNWRPSQDYTKTYSANKSMGGGIVLDCIHEIDYVAWMLGKPKKVLCIKKKTSDLEIDVDDTADLMLEYDSHTATIHLDYLQKVKRRGCTVLGTEGSISWMSIGKNPENSMVIIAATSAQDRFTEIIDANAPYLEELEHFLSCIRGEAKPVSDITSGRLALEIALDCEGKK
jgi:predicted dehydrogenase